MLQSNHYIKSRNSTRDGETWNIENDKFLFGILVNIHQDALNYLERDTNKSADEILDVVLKDLEKNNLGVPPSKSFFYTDQFRAKSLLELWVTTTDTHP